MPVSTKQRNWLANLYPRAARRVFPNSGRTGPTLERRTAALLDFIQRNDLHRIKKVSSLDDALAELVLICMMQGDGSFPAALSARPKIEAGELAGFAAEVRGGINGLLQGRYPLSAPPGLMRVWVWNRSTAAPADSYFTSPFVIKNCLWRAQELVGKFIHRIGVCQREACKKFFIVRKRAKFCSAKCGGKVRAAAFVRNLTPEAKKELRQTVYLRRLWLRNRKAAEVYLRRLSETDSERAEKLREKLTEYAPKRRSKIEGKERRRPA
jgi:hypothetical protein